MCILPTKVRDFSGMISGQFIKIRINRISHYYKRNKTKKVAISHLHLKSFYKNRKNRVLSDEPP
jgi:hypothetical protein